MKKVYFKVIFLFFILLGIKSNAQQIDEYRHITDSLFQHLDKSGVTTGVLYDRGFPLSALNNFNLVATDTMEIN